MEIKVTRPKQYTDKFRNYYLWADDQKIGKIKSNSTTTYIIPDDTLKIRATIDWCSSQEFEINNLKSNQVVISNTFGSNFLSVLLLLWYYITFGKNKYLTIESGI
ncbi:MAG: hypothetical protein CENE_03296 [Candidatus Celerinatantimonas neptuna]|nr:MAG: hypothetical protein CENE_03296 [Candidatus Celerinatantimonas neptuna]